MATQSAEPPCTLDQREIGSRNIDLDLVDEYLADQFAHRRPRRGEAFTLREFVGLVSVDDAAVNKQPIAAAPAVQMRRKFEHYLLHERGLAPASIRLYGDAIGRFLEHVFGAGEVRLSVLSAADVVRFVQLDAARLQHPKRAKVMTSALRSFLQCGRYLGDIRIDLPASVPTVANWSMAGIPRSISPLQVDSVLARCDRQRADGRRDYGVLLLLARLAERGAFEARIYCKNKLWHDADIFLHLEVWALAVGAGGNNSASINTCTQTHVHTGGGAYVRGNVSVEGGGDFVGRDKVIHGDDPTPEPRAQERRSG